MERESQCKSFYITRKHALVSNLRQIMTIITTISVIIDHTLKDKCCNMVEYQNIEDWFAGLSKLEIWSHLHPSQQLLPFISHQIVVILSKRDVKGKL